jgi:hypothetical protein
MSQLENAWEGRNMKKLTTGIITLLLSICGLVAQATVYEITVEVDETTAGDLDMLETFMVSADSGTQVPRSLRRITMGAVGELTLAVKARIDANGNLTLDDGTVAPLFDGDTIELMRVGPGRCGKAVFHRHQLPSGDIRPRLARFFVCTPSGTKCISIPPVYVGGCPG